jgi:hypothetical protein
VGTRPSRGYRDHKWLIDARPDRVYRIKYLSGVLGRLMSIGLIDGLCVLGRVVCIEVIIMARWLSRA